MDNEFLSVPIKEKKTYEVDYDSLGQQAVEKLIAREVDHICGIFGVDVRYPRDLSGHTLTRRHLSRRTRLVSCCGI
jgi:hypothetical protein